MTHFFGVLGDVGMVFWVTHFFGVLGDVGMVFRVTHFFGVLGDVEANTRRRSEGVKRETASSTRIRVRSDTPQPVIPNHEVVRNLAFVGGEVASETKIRGSQ